MMQYIPFVICAVAGYLLGSIETAIFLSKFKYKDDVRTHGSGNSGSTNMLRVYGKKAGVITFIGDIAKGAIAVFLGCWIASLFSLDKIECGCIAGLFAVIGHDFPIFFNFKGGKGVATTLAVGSVLFPEQGVIALVIAAIVILITRYVSLAAIICMTVFTVYIIIAHNSNTILLISVLCMWVLMVTRHAENIKRLIKGEENKVFDKKNKS